MSSLKADFEELRERIRHGHELGHASFEPIYYLVFHPSRILEVKRETPAWIAKLRNDNWEVEVLSMADAIAAILDAHALRKFWVAGDHKAPLDWAKTNQSLRQALTQGDALLKRVESALERLQDKAHAILLVTDLEALHPYLRIGAIEGRLQGKFHVPTIFLYPGVRSGKTRLSFLGFYPEDGNYRSVHVGG